MRRLRDIDLRINGTLAMLHDFPDIESKVRPAALQFWADYRRNNTPHTTDVLATSIGAEGKDDKLMQIYESKVRVERVSDDEDDFDQPAKLSPELVKELEMVGSRAADKKVNKLISQVPGIEPVLSVGEHFPDEHMSNARDDRLLVSHEGFASRLVAPDEPTRHTRCVSPSRRTN